MEIAKASLSNSSTPASSSSSSPLMSLSRPSDRGTRVPPTTHHRRAPGASTTKTTMTRGTFAGFTTTLTTGLTLSVGPRSPPPPTTTRSTTTPPPPHSLKQHRRLLPNAIIPSAVHVISDYMGVGCL